MLNPAHKNKHYGSKQGSGEQYSFRQRALIVIIVTISICVALGVYGLSLSNRVLYIDNQWTEYDQKASAASHSLAEIEGHFGYGGFIHNFKNYVLRKDPALIVRVKNDLRDTLQAINTYPLDNAHEDVKLAVNVIRSVVKEYSDKFELAQKLIAENKPSGFIDQQVRVDDRAAIKAFRFLNQHILQHSREQKLETTVAVDETLWVLSLGILLFPGILLVGGIIIMFIRYDVRANKQLESSREYLSHLFKAAPDAMLIVNRAGNIINANLKAIDLLGYSLDELSRLRVEDLMPKRFRQDHEKIREGSFEKPKSRTFSDQAEFSAVTKEGKEIPIDISLSYMFDEGETQAITTLRDISERKQIEMTLRRKENMLNKAQSITHIGSWEWDIPNNKLVWSDEIFNIFGLQREEFGASYDGFVERLHPDDREAVINAVNEAVVYDKPYNINHRIVRPDGEERFVRERGEVFRDESGEAQYMIGTVLDITEQKLAERELRIADNVFNQTSECIMVTDDSNHILRVNKAFSRVTGFSSDEAIGKTPKEILQSGKQDLESYAHMWFEILGQGSWQGELLDRRKDGTHFPCWHNISAITDDDGNIIQFTSIFRDITEEKRAKEHIKYLAQFDQLTKLPNRTLFNDRLYHALSRAKRNKKQIGLMFIDLDGFKNVNDTLGHQAGDLLLQEVAQRLLSCVREQDTVARLGGDEFTIILEDLRQADDVALIADKILKSLSIEIPLDEHEASIGASIGISVYPDDGEDADSIIKKADMAMYHSKKQGKNQYQFYTSELDNM